MKLFKKSLLLLAALVGGSMTYASAEENYQLLFSFKTTLYQNAGANNVFHFNIGASEDTYIDVDFGAGPVEVEVSQAKFDASSSSIDATFVSGSVGASGEVKVYGDPALIDYLDLEGIYIYDLYLNNLPELQVFSVRHNKIPALDLSAMTKLQSVDVSDNPFDVKPLILGPNKPELAILEMAMVQNVDPSFNFSDYHALLSVDAMDTNCLTKCDVSGCPELLRLSIDNTDVETLDLTNNQKLLILNITGTKITEIDLSPCPYLTEFYASHWGNYNTDYKLKSIDFTKNPELQRIFISYNFLPSVDLSNNPKLTDFAAAYNDFTSLDIENNPHIINLDLSNNLLDFATLPLPRVGLNEYYYYQRDLPVQRSYAVGTVIDFSDKVLREGGETVMGLFSKPIDDKGNAELTQLDDDYFKFEDGKVTLLKETSDSVYIAFHNSLFPEYDLYTRKFLVKSEQDFGYDNPVITFRAGAAVSTLSMGIGLRGASADNPKSFSVDFGDGNPVTFITTTSQIPAEPNAVSAPKGSRQIVIYVPEGEDISAWQVKDAAISVLNIDKAPLLEYLDVQNCRLTTLSTKWNNKLRSVNLDNNRLSILDLSAINGDFFKTFLSNISAANNRITEFLLEENRSLYHLNLSNNQLEAINLANTDNLLTLNVANNKLDEISLEHTLTIQSLDASNNNISSFEVPEYVTSLEDVNIAGNKIAIPNLPRPADFKSLTYAPQQQWSMPVKAPTASLGTQWLDVDGQVTEYTWRLASDNSIVPEGTITGKEGRFKFNDPDLGLVYCEFSHPLFPDFTGENIYRTTNIETAPIPENVVFSLTTLADGIGQVSLAATLPNTLLYIDWSGKGDLEEYILGDTYSVHNVNVTAGAEVKAYTYNAEDGLSVVSIAAGPLAEFDASGMKTLKHFTSIGSKLPLDKFKLPQSPNLKEIRLASTEIDAIDLSTYPKLEFIALSSNKLTSFDASPFKALQVLYVDGNLIENLTLDNPAMWELAASGNKLSSIDFSNATALQQLWLNNNQFEEIDFSPLPDLRRVDISGNKFLFTTLPPVKSQYSVYGYNNQAPVQVEPVDGVVDLSSQAMVGNTATNYRWFLGTPYFDDNNELYGEELVKDDEYTLENGVSTFHYDFQNAICVMTNALFPQLYLYTNFMDIEKSGVESVAVDADGVIVISGQGTIHIAAPALTSCRVYNAAGSSVASAVISSNDTADITNLAPGLYIVVVGNNSAKVLVK